MSLTSETPSRLNSETLIVDVDVHAVHTSATMFLYQLFGRLAKYLNFDFYSENNNPPKQKRFDSNNQSNFCRCPIRTFDILETSFENPTQRHLIFLTRDPRDILVSQYYSIAWIHPTEGTQLDQHRHKVHEMSIDETVFHQVESSSRTILKNSSPCSKGNRTVNSKLL